MKKIKIYPGVTLVELTVAIAVLSILVSVVIVNLSNARLNSQASSALQSVSAIPAEISRCFYKFPDTAAPDTNSLTSPPNTANSICSQNGAEFPKWPNIAKVGWAYGVNRFFWCTPNYDFSSGVFPPSANKNNTYTEGSMGGDRATGNFCFVLCGTVCTTTTPARWIGCNNSGCYKKGF